MTIRRIAARPESNSQGLWINQRVMRRECRRLLIRRVVRKIVITGAPWRIRAAGGSLAGDKHTIAGKDTSCSSVRTWVASSRISRT
jgi:hypothetical protein